MCVIGLYLWEEGGGGGLMNVHWPSQNLMKTKQYVAYGSN